MSPILSKVNSDTQLKQLSKHFFRITKKSILRNSVSILKSIKENKVQIVGDLMLKSNSASTEALSQLITRAQFLLGPVLGNEDDIKKCAWSSFAKCVSKDQKECDFFTTFINSILLHTHNETTYIIPNHVVLFQENVESIKIGPVEAVRGDKVVRENSLPNHIRSASGSNLDYFFAAEGTTISVPPVCWRVSITSAKGHIEEEAAWKIDIALSFLRLNFIGADSWFPHIGKIEANPRESVQDKIAFILIEMGSVMARTPAHPRIYEINTEMVRESENSEFKERAHSIFHGPASHLSARFAQGLGWMTRARRAEDRSQRFLFFFTALEALLSSDDKSAPVVQTIARHAAVLLTDNNRKRESFAHRIRILYGIRSSLVHSGARNVSLTDSKSVQELVERIYIKTMQTSSLNKPFKDFQMRLSQASYGIKWK